MKRKTDVLKLILYTAAMLVLILDSKTALLGARDGLDMCIKSVIPSLFPFFMIIPLLNNTLSQIPTPCAKRIARIFGMPEQCAQYLIPAFLGGYPVGAQCIADSYRSGALSRQQAHRLLGYCSNAGPAFIFGICSAVFSAKWVPWALWMIHISSALAVGMILPRVPCITNSTQKSVNISVSGCLEKTVKTMGLVCGWVVIFRVLLFFIDRWFLWMLSPYCAVIIKGLAELSNGCIDAIRLNNQAEIFTVLAAILGFGGLCVLLQTRSVTMGLGSGAYLTGKLLQGCISFLTAYFLSPVFFTDSVHSKIPTFAPFVSGFIIVLVLLYTYRKKIVAIYRKVIYNGKKHSREKTYVVSQKAPQSL